MGSNLPFSSTKFSCHKWGPSISHPAQSGLSDCPIAIPVLLICSDQNVSSYFLYLGVVGSCVMTCEMWGASVKENVRVEGVKCLKKW